MRAFLLGLFLLAAMPAWADDLAPTWTTNVQVRFKIGDYSDALTFTAEDYTKQTQDSLTAAMQARYAAHQAQLKAAAAPTKADFQSQIDAVDGQIADLEALKAGGADAQIADLQKQKTSLEAALEAAK